MVVQYAARSQGLDALLQISVRHLDHAHHHSVGNAYGRHLRAVAQDGLHYLFDMVLPDILAEIMVGVRVQFNGHDLARPGMNGHGQREVANSGKHVHNEFVLAKKAHAHAFIQIASREHHLSGIQLEEHAILTMHRLRPGPGDRLAHRLPKLALDAIVA